MADDGVKQIRSISPSRRTFTHDLLNVIDAVLASAPIEAISLNWSFLLCCFTALAPHKRPIKYLIDVAELADCGIERVAGDRQRLIRTSEQLSRNILALDFQCELAIERIAVSKTPDTNAFTARRYLLIGINRSLQVILGPFVDAVRNKATTMIEIDCPERVVFRENVAQSICMPGLHSSKCSSVVAPGARIARAGVPLRLQC
jgi:hypothetical protein